MFNLLRLSTEANNWGLVYSSEGYSFETLSRNDSGSGLSLLINDINLSLDACGEIDAIWGMCGHPSWGIKRLDPPNALVGVLQYSDYFALTPGVSRRLNFQKRWSVVADPSSGWVCIDSAEYSDLSVMVAQGIILELDRSMVAKRLWLKPDGLPLL